MSGPRGPHVNGLYSVFDRNASGRYPNSVSGTHIGFYLARRTPQTIGRPTQNMWISSCGQPIDPGHRGVVCR